MAKQKNHSQQSAGSKAHQSTKKVDPNHKGISEFVEQLHSLNTFQLLAGFSQLGLGLTVVFVCVVGLIQPLWLSAFLVFMASVSITTGIYFCYKTIAEINDNTLLRDAMRRIVEDQN